MASELQPMADLAPFYRQHLMDVMGFWRDRVVDPEGPGYLYQFDRQGRLTSTTKNMWVQGRQTYMFAAMYNHIERADIWLDLAKRGRDVLVNHGHAGEGRFVYKLDRDGSVLESNRSLFTDIFAVMGLAEYAAASGSDEDRALIRRGYERIVEHLNTPGFDEYHHFSLDPARQYHGPHMAFLSLAGVVRPVLGDEALSEQVGRSLNKVLHVFAKDEYSAHFEQLDHDGHVIEDDLGLRLNPGHAIESMWFCMEEGLHRGDSAIVDRAIEISDWMYRLGEDTERGGIFAFVDPRGRKPARLDDIQAWGEDWDRKIWWVHSEALYTFALAAAFTGRADLVERFLRLHDYTQRVFADHEYGEWYPYCDRDGTPTDDAKGNWIKCAFHVPRNLMKVTLLLEGLATR